MYSKVYWITTDAAQSAGLRSHYDSVAAPAIRDNDHHLSHQMVDIQPGKWILVSNYRSADAAEAAGPLVRDLVAAMSEGFSMTLEVIGEGETIWEVS
jgi:hypothetical protein